MTDPSTNRRRVPGRRPTFVGGWPLVAMTSVAIFLSAFAWMAWRVRTGQDPVLGNATVKRTQIPPRHIKRIVVVRKVIITKLPPRVQAAPAAAYSAPAGNYSPPASTYSPPAYSPPPAPAPAPVSRGS